MSGAWASLRRRHLRRIDPGARPQVRASGLSADAPFVGASAPNVTGTTFTFVANPLPRLANRGSRAAAPASDGEKSRFHAGPRSGRKNLLGLCPQHLSFAHDTQALHPQLSVSGEL
jgi:hypothetical protein